MRPSIPHQRLKAWLGLVLLTLMMIMPSPVFGQSRSQRLRNICLFPVRLFTPSVTSCVFTTSCPYGYLCRGGMCIQQPQEISQRNDQPNAKKESFPDPDKSGQAITAPPKPTTNEECSRDRRCRINRLRRNNNARRYVDMTQQEAYVMQYQRRYKETVISDIYRLVDPITAEFILQMNNPALGAGLIAGYTFSGKFRLEVGWSYADDYVYLDNFEEDLFLDGNIDMSSFSLVGTYMFKTSWWSPYLSAGLIYATGEFGSFDNFSSSGLSVLFHALHAAAGVDFQSSFGLRGRLGLVYRYPVYVRAAFGPGQYDETTREGLRAWYSQDMSILPEFSFGWAF